jgi:hypothetical protein
LFIIKGCGEERFRLLAASVSTSDSGLPTAAHHDPTLPFLGYPAFGHVRGRHPQTFWIFFRQQHRCCRPWVLAMTDADVTNPAWSSSAIVYFCSDAPAVGGLQVCLRAGVPQRPGNGWHRAPPHVSRCQLEFGGLPCLTALKWGWELLTDVYKPPVENSPCIHRSTRKPADIWT